MLCLLFPEWKENSFSTMQQSISAVNLTRWKFPVILSDGFVAQEENQNFFFLSQDKGLLVDIIKK